MSSPQDRPPRVLPRGGWGLALRLLVSAALLYWLFHNLQGGWARLGAVQPQRLSPALLVFTLSTILGGLQWGLLLRHAGVALPLPHLLRVYWIGLFFNNFLPSNVGGDLVKVADVSWSTGATGRVVAGTLLDRLLGLCALSTLGLVAAAILGGPRPAGLPLGFLALVSVGLLSLSALLLSRRLGQALLRLMRGWRWRGLGERAAVLIEDFQQYRRSPRFLLGVVALALVVQGLRVLTHVLVAWALEIPLDLQTLLGLYVLIPVLGVAIVLPISFNGLGLREFIATRLLPGIGIGAEAAFALQIATYLVQVLVSALGGVFFGLRLLRGWRSRHGSAAGPAETVTGEDPRIR
jgi:hypothetical protein